VGGETEQHVSGWTVDTLALHYQRQLDDLRDLLNERAANQRTAMDAALAAADRATSKAELAANARFESVNEFRQTLADQAGRLMSRAEATALLEALADRMTRIEERLNLLAGRDSGESAAAATRRAGTQQVAQIIGAVVAVVSVAVVLILGLNN
jgi:hypothetical protein